MAWFLYVVWMTSTMRHRVPLMNRPSLLIVAAALFASPASGFAAHEESHDRSRDGARTAGQVQDEQPGGRGRLRFRDGPVCMCSLGMNEEDIERAQEERRRGGWRRN